MFVLFFLHLLQLLRKTSKPWSRAKNHSRLAYFTGQNRQPKQSGRKWAFSSRLSRAGNNRLGSIRYVESKTNGVRFGRGHVVRSLHIAQHTTLQIMTINLLSLYRWWKKIKKKDAYSYLRHSAFTANPREITVRNFASTFDNADHRSWHQPRVTLQ